VSKLVWNDAGGYAGGSSHFVEAVPELTDQGLLAIWTRQQPAIGRQWIERTEKAQALDKLTHKCVYRHHSFRLELAQRNVNRPAIAADIAKAIIGEIDTFTNTHTGMAQQQEDVGRQIIAAEQLLLDELILLCRQGSR
jgi:hypothetical protein